MAASLMAASGLTPEVLGIDIAILPHTRDAIASSLWAENIQLLEADSTSAASLRFVEDAIQALQPGDIVMMTLDSDHSEEHVLSELQNLGPLLPSGSVVLVADTVIEELPDEMMLNRPWCKGNSPASAITKFLAMDDRFWRSTNWGRRGLLSEFRDGILIRR